MNVVFPKQSSAQAPRKFSKPPRASKAQSNRPQPTCFRCGGVGHIVSQCPTPSPNGAPARQNQPGGPNARRAKGRLGSKNTPHRGNKSPVGGHNAKPRSRPIPPQGSGPRGNTAAAQIAASILDAEQREAGERDAQEEQDEASPTGRDGLGDGDEPGPDSGAEIDAPAASIAPHHGSSKTAVSLATAAGLNGLHEQGIIATPAVAQEAGPQAPVDGVPAAVPAATEGNPSPAVDPEYDTWGDDPAYAEYAQAIRSSPSFWYWEYPAVVERGMSWVMVVLAILMTVFVLAFSFAAPMFLLSVLTSVLVGLGAKVAHAVSFRIMAGDSYATLLTRIWDGLRDTLTIARWYTGLAKDFPSLEVRCKTCDGCQLFEKRATEFVRKTAPQLDLAKLVAEQVERMNIGEHSNPKKKAALGAQSNPVEKAKADVAPVPEALKLPPTPEEAGRKELISASTSVPHFFLPDPPRPEFTRPVFPEVDPKLLQALAPLPTNTPSCRPDPIDLREYEKEREKEKEAEEQSDDEESESTEDSASEVLEEFELPRGGEEEKTTECQVSVPVRLFNWAERHCIDAYHNSGAIFGASYILVLYFILDRIYTPVLTFFDRVWYTPLETVVREILRFISDGRSSWAYSVFQTLGRHTDLCLGFLIALSLFGIVAVLVRVGYSELFMLFCKTTVTIHGPAEGKPKKGGVVDRRAAVSKNFDLGDEELPVRVSINKTFLGFTYFHAEEVASLTMFLECCNHKFITITGTITEARERISKVASQMGGINIDRLGVLAGRMSANFAAIIAVGWARSQDRRTAGWCQDF